jgi:hypothetical protein
MKNTEFKDINFAGVKFHIPENWRYKTEEFQDEDGTKSYGLMLSERGRNARSVNMSWGTMPEGTNAYTEACATYEQVVGEEDLSDNDECIMCFEFIGHEAYGFNVYAENGLPCFFLCSEIPSADKMILLTVLAGAANVKDIEDLLDYIEENLTIE